MSLKVSKSAYLIALSLLLPLMVVFSSCKEEELIEVESIELNESSITLKEDETVRLTATIHPANATDKAVVWGSEDTDVANIYNEDDNGNAEIYGSGAGSTTIFVETLDGKHRAECTVKVLPKEISVEGISLSDESITMNVGDEFQLSADIYPSDATNKNMTWNSSNESVATISNGKVIANQAGETTITVTTEDGGKTATCEVTVNEKVNPVTGITLDKSSYEMTEGEEITLTVTITPDNATNKNVTWSSSNSSVASVTNGKITAIKSGKTTITASSEDGNHSASCSIVVKEYVPSWGIVGTFNKWGETGRDIVVSDAKYENYYVAENVSFTKGDEFKFRYNNDWEQNYGMASDGVTITINRKYSLTSGGVNIVLASGGNYDVYLSKSFNAFYIMNKGKVPEDAIVVGGEAKPSWGLCGTMNEWGEKGDLDIVMFQSSYENYYVATGVALTADTEFKFRYNNNWEKNYGGEHSISTFTINSKYSTVSDGKNISVSKAGTYDIYLSKSYDYFYIMSENKSPDDAESSDIAVTGVTLNKTSISLTEGETCSLTCTVKPSNASDKSVVWTSSNSTIASVNNNGKVTAINEGTAVITVKTNDGGYTAECEVIVNSPTIEDNITLNSSSNNTVSYSANDYAISFTSANAWEATTDCDWITISPNSGASGNNSISVQVAENTSTTQRTGNVTITSGTASAKVSYTQDGTTNTGGDGENADPDDYTKISLKVDMSTAFNFNWSDAEWEDYINKSYTSSNMTGYGADYNNIEYRNGWITICFDGNVTTIPGVLPYSSYAEIIVLPNSVIHIGDNAFANHSTCTAINIPTSLQTIDKEAFAYVTCIKDLVLPESVVSIGQGAFFGCSNMTSVTIPSSVKTISTLAFSSSGLIEISIPSSVQKIETLAFHSCVNLKKVTIGNNTQVATMEVDQSVFQQCTSLKEVVVGSEVKVLGMYAFEGCNNLTNVTLGDNMSNSTMEIGNKAFTNCTSLAYLTLNSEVDVIGEDAFSSCTSLQTLTIQGTVSSIGRSAFESCSSLKSLIIGDNDTSHGTILIFHRFDIIV